MVTTRSSSGKKPPSSTQQKKSSPAMTTRTSIPTATNDDGDPTLADVLPLIHEYLKSFPGLFSRTLTALNAEQQLKKVKTALEECGETRVLDKEKESLMEVCKHFAERKRKREENDEGDGAAKKKAQKVSSGTEAAAK